MFYEITIDKEHHMAYIQLSNKKVEHTTQLSPDINVDYDISRNVAGIEILNTLISTEDLLLQITECSS